MPRPEGAGRKNSSKAVSADLKRTKMAPVYCRSHLKLFLMRGSLLLCDIGSMKARGSYMMKSRTQ
eukprot:8014985-Pyramimonas_sp.AAC.1